MQTAAVQLRSGSLSPFTGEHGPGAALPALPVPLPIMQQQEGLCSSH